MRDYQAKSNVGALPDSNAATKLGGGEASSLRNEAKNAVSLAGLTLAPQDGTGEDASQLAQALFINGTSASAFQDGGAADAIALTPVTGSTGLKLPPDYTTLDGAEVSFFAAFATLTTTPTASIGQTGGAQFGVKTITREDGTALSIGDITTTVMTTLRRDDASDTWLLIRGAGTFVTSTVLPTGFIQGLTLANNVTDAVNDMDIATGSCRDLADAADIVLASALIKRIDATWVTGTNQGGRASTVALTNDTWYHVFAIIVAGVADVGFDTSVTGANLIADHSATSVRRVGSILYGTATIVGFTQHGNYFVWDTPATDLNGAGSLSRVLQTMSSPLDVETFVFFNFDIGSGEGLYVCHPDADDLAPSITTTPGASGYISAGIGAMQLSCLTNTSSQIARRCFTTDTHRFFTYQYQDLGI